MLLYIVRHGYPDYARDCLTELGRAQAVAVGKRLSNSGIDEIYSSPMGRARETAQPLCDLLHQEMTILPWAHELGPEVFFPDPDGGRTSVYDIPRAHTLTKGVEKLGVEDTFRVPGYRDAAGLETKCRWIWNEADRFLADHGYVRQDAAYRMVAPNDKRIALFCHGGFGGCLIAHLLHIPVHIFWSCLDISHTGVTVIEFRNEACGFTSANCLCLDDLSHIYAEGLPFAFEGRLNL